MSTTIVVAAVEDLVPLYQRKVFTTDKIYAVLRELRREMIIACGKNIEWQDEVLSPT